MEVMPVVPMMATIVVIMAVLATVFALLSYAASRGKEPGSSRRSGVFGEPRFVRRYKPVPGSERAR